MPTPSLALNNLRTFAVLLVLAVHASAAYLGSSPASPFRFDDPPFRWRALPVIDSDRWFGFDIFCAHQDTCLIALLFFISGLFVWPSLARKDAWNFLRDRVIRIGIPFALAVGLLMPIAHYPVYSITAVDPGVAAYWRHWLALPLWPSGPPWFLWVLLVFDLCAAVLYRFGRGFRLGRGNALRRIACWLGERPAALVTALLTASTLAYVPLALAFTPWAWFQAGPFAFQECRPLLYAVWFFAGIGVGAHGIERGLLAPGGWLAQRWRSAGGAAFATFAVWLTCAAMASLGSPSTVVRVAEAVSFVPCCTAGCLFMLAVFVRFANRPVRAFEAFCDKTYGMYLVHYLFSVWLQFLLLGLVLPGLVMPGFSAIAVIKAAIVFCGTVALSGGTVALAQRAMAVLRDERKRNPGAVLPS
jgi:hypothetical protein